MGRQPEPTDVTFNGTPAGEYPPTWGQQYMWDALRHIDPADGWSFRVELDPAEPAGRRATLDDLLDALRLLIERHAGLRTRFHLDIASRRIVRQVVAAHGTVPVHLFNGRPGDGTADRLRAAMTDPAAGRFDPAGDWPIRILAAVTDGEVCAAGLIISHLVLDGAALQVLLRDLRLAISTGRITEPVTVDPIVLAARQHEGRCTARTRAAVRHFRPAIETAAHNALGAVRHPGAPRAYEARLPSDVLDSAQRYIVRRLRLFTPGSVVLTAAAAFLGRLCGAEHAVFDVPYNNRFDTSVASCVAQLSQPGYIAVSAVEPDLAAEIARVDRAMMSAARHCSYDPAPMQALIDSNAADLSLFFNNLQFGSATADDHAFAREHEPAPVVWLDTPPLGSGAGAMKLLIRLRYWDGRADLAVRADSSYLAQHEIVAMLHAVERSVVGLARTMLAT